MKKAKGTLKALLAFSLVICTGCLTAQAQTQTPGATAWSATQQALSQDLSNVTAQSVTSGAQALMSKAKSPSTGKKSSAAAAAQPAAMPAASMLPSASQTTAAPAPVPVQRYYDARRTLFVTAGQTKLRLEAPEKMCFLDRTSPMQEGIVLMVTGITERDNDQVLLGVFMKCDSIMSPDGWQDGMPDAGFVTWLNPSVGETTRMSRQDYLDMREASFPKYAQTRMLGNHLAKTVHRNAVNVSIGVTDDSLGQDGLRHKSTSILSTTTVKHVPLEITMHYAGDIYDGKLAPKLPEAYAAVDKLVAQQIKLNE